MTFDDLARGPSGPPDSGRSAPTHGVSNDRANLGDALEDLRHRLAVEVRSSNADDHEVALDHLSWSYAYVEAARAVREWADATGDVLARKIADAAESEARAMLFGRSATQVIEDGLRCEAIARLSVPFDDLDAAPEHRVLRASLREFSEGIIRPRAQAIHLTDADIPEEIIRGIAARGLFGLSIPEAYGGSQREHADNIAMVVATEELSRGSLAVSGLATRGEILIRALLRAGTSEQKRRWLPRIARGEHLVAVAVTEPAFGSDIANLECRADRAADGSWEITGRKVWCGLSARAELLMVLCRTGGPGRKGLSIIVLEKPVFAGREFEHHQERGGALFGRAIRAIGYRGLRPCELTFDRYHAPASALLGEREWLDRGFELQLEGFAMGRLQTAGRAVGVMEAALEDALRYSKERYVFGRPEFAFQLVRAKLGSMAVRLHSARHLAYRAARLMDEGRGQMEAALAKLYAARAAEFVTRDAMQLHGARGYAEETEVSRLFVDARVLAIFEGTEDVLSLRVIGRDLLKQA